MITLLLLCAVGPFIKPVDALGDPLPPHAVARLGARRMWWSQYEDPVLSPDGRRAAVADHDRLWLFDTVSGRRTRLPTPGVSDAVPCAFTPNGWLLVANGDVLSKVPGLWAFDPAGAKPGRTVLSGEVTKGMKYRRLAVSDGRFGFATEKGIELHDMTSGKRLRTIEHGLDGITTTVLSPDGSTLAVGGWRPEEGKHLPGVHLWDARTGERKGRVATDIHDVHGAAFSPDGKRLAVAGSEKGKDASVSVWDLAAGKQVVRVPVGPWVRVTFSADGERFAVGETGWGGGGGAGGIVEVFSVAGKRLRRCPPPDRLDLTDLRFRGDDLVAAGKSSATAVVWEPLTGKLVVPPGGHIGRIDSLAFSADGSRLYSGSTDGGRVWDRRSGALVRPLRPPWAEKRPEVHGVATFSPRGRYAAFVEAGGFGLHVVEVADGKVVVERASGVGRYSRMAGFTAAEDRMAVAFDGPAGSRLQVWDLPAMRLRAEVPHTGDAYDTRLTLSADGALLAVARYYPEFDRGQSPVRPDGLVRVIDVADRKERWRFPHPSAVTNLSFLSDSRSLAVSGPRMGVLLDARTGKSQLERKAMSSMQLAVSPDGRLLAVAEDRIGDSDVTIEERASGFRRLRLPIHTEFPTQGRAIRSLAFSPDGQYLAVGTLDGSLLVFDLTGLAERRVPPRPDAYAWESMTNAGWSPAPWLAYPAEAGVTLRERLKPAPGKPLGEDAIKRHITSLSAEDYATREAASKALAAAPNAAALVETAMKKATDLEGRRRMERLLEGYRGPARGSLLRELRAVEVLEHLRVPDARRLLAELAGGNADARLTGEAKAALGRMRR